MNIKSFIPHLTLIVLLLTAYNASSLDHKYTNNNGVNIHYVAEGNGPVILFIHGFPDFWYSWRHQIQALKSDFRILAMDTRGYNDSDKPDLTSDYSINHLVSDAHAVLAAESANQAIIAGHDWGGMIAWNFAFTYPDITSHLIILNLPHPNGLSRELAHNPEQQAHSQYARNFKMPNSESQLTPGILASIVTRDPTDREVYIEAFKKSNIRSMMDYYRSNYPDEPYTIPNIPFPSAGMPVLQFHGLKDTALHRKALNDTWDWVQADYTLVTLPQSGHWPHHDQPDVVSNTMRWWLKSRLP